MIWLWNNLICSLLYLNHFSQLLYRFLFFKACCFFLLFKTFLYNSEQSVFHIQKCLGIFAAKCTSCNAWYILLCISHLILSDHSVNLSIDQQIITECKINFAVSDIPPAVFILSFIHIRYPQTSKPCLSANTSSSLFYKVHHASWVFAVSYNIT